MNELLEGLQNGRLSDEEILGSWTEKYAPLEKEYPGSLLKLRVTALLRCEQYTEALAVLKAAPGALKDSLRLQEAYCLYRTGALSKGLELLNKNDGALSGQAVPAAHLKAQILYRLHRYSETFHVYSKISSGEDSAELRTNCLAVMAASAASGSVLQDKEVTGKSVPEVYEEAYNLACLHMAKGSWSQARSMLERAKELLNESLMDTDSQETVKWRQRELGMLRGAEAYMHQKQGREKEAQSEYQATLSENKKNLEPSVSAVLQNNLLSLKSGKGLVKAAKKYSPVKVPANKLTLEQSKVFAINEASALLHKNQAEGARTKAGQLLEMYPDNEHLQLVLLASKSTGDQKTKKKKPIEILADLEGIQKAHPSSHSLSVLLAQLYAEEKRYSEATAVLESLLSISTNSVRHSPNKVFMLCSLHQKAGHPEESVKVLSEACAFWASTDPEASEYAELLKERAQQRLSGRQFAEAALDLELIVKRDPTDKVSLASLIRAYLEYAPAMAEKYASYLPPLPVSKSVDVARLESYADFVKPKAMAAPVTAPVTKKRKRKPILPKNYDPNVKPDPERWLAKRDRMAFRKKGKGKKDVSGSGPQGTALPGGFGGTGSAKIGRPVAQSAPSPSAATPEDMEMKDAPTAATTTGSKTSTNKKKQKGRK